jgi:hypothetical protein
MKLRKLLAAGLLAWLSQGIAHAAVCSVGDKADVLWKGTWYPATVTKVNDDQSRCFIRYTGYGSEWDEWVGQDRIRIKEAGASTAAFGVGDAVEVKWKGSWYPASVLETKNGKYKIHYDGYSNSWDEWVGPNRIRAK